MWGISYLGYVQWAVVHGLAEAHEAAGGHDSGLPSLSALVPVMTSSDMYPGNIKCTQLNYPCFHAFVCVCVCVCCSVLPKWNRQHGSLAALVAHHTLHRWPWVHWESAAQTNLEAKTVSL